MKVKCSIVGLVDRVSLEWPEGWQIPTEGSLVSLPSAGKSLYVRRVVWYPEGDNPDGDSPEYQEPFVYIVLAPTDRMRS